MANQIEAKTADNDQPFCVVIVGHVNYGKSTLVGHLCDKIGSLPDGTRNATQEIAIDTSHNGFKTDLRDYELIDAPGHGEFLKSMVTGPTSPDAAFLVIDSVEGVCEESRRHGCLLSLLGVSQVAVVISKMDAVDYSQDRYNEIVDELGVYLESAGIRADFFIPISAREGQNISVSSGHMDWYTGRTLVKVLDSFKGIATAEDLPLRFPVQDVSEFEGRRLIAGRIVSGRLRVGDMLLFAPSNKMARVATFEKWHGDTPKSAAVAGESVSITLEEQIFVECGEVGAVLDNPPAETNRLKARIFWLANDPLKTGNTYALKIGTATHQVLVEAVESVIDTSDLSTSKSDTVLQNAVAEVILQSRTSIVLDAISDNTALGRFVLVQGDDTAGGGIVLKEGFVNQAKYQAIKSTNIHPFDHRVSTLARQSNNGHKSGVIWMTGLSGSGKSTLALGLEQRLFKKGYQVYVLDGDNVRQGLNGDLGFGAEDRTENIRRVGEVAKLFAHAGFIVIAAFISPYQADRDRAREIQPELFHEVHIKADIEACEGRDPKGLYKKAREEGIPDFTGISAPYEEPVNPELVVDTVSLSINESIQSLVTYVETHFADDQKIDAIG
jgi:bifunctional enzyme CysN/CysC